jgi:hypothetical protein
MLAIVEDQERPLVPQRVLDRRESRAAKILSDLKERREGMGKERWI